MGPSGRESTWHINSRIQAVIWSCRDFRVLSLSSFSVVMFQKTRKRVENCPLRLLACLPPSLPRTLACLLALGLSRSVGRVGVGGSRARGWRREFFFPRTGHFSEFKNRGREGSNNTTECPILRLGLTNILQRFNGTSMRISMVQYTFQT